MSAPRLFTKGQRVRWGVQGECTLEYGPFQRTEAAPSIALYLVRYGLSRDQFGVARAVDLVPIPEPRWVPVPVDNFRWRPPDGTTLDLTYPGKPGYTLERLEDGT